MKIDDYNFGLISIDGKKYFKDVIILEDKVISPWIREEGHKLKVKDLENYLKDIVKVKNIIIGTGYSGLMKVSNEVLNFLKGNDIEFYILKTKEACDKFNSFLKENKNAIAFFHLTC